MVSKFNNGSLKLIENLGAGTENVTINTPSLISSYTLTFPNTIGLANNVLSTGSTPGDMEWVSLNSNSWRQKVITSSVANVVLSPSPTSIDDVFLSNGDRVLLKNQSSAAENGIYIYLDGDLVRADDSINSEDASGTVVYVTDGSTNKSKIYYCTDPQGSSFDSGLTFEELNITKVMTGPNSSVDNSVAAFDGTTGAIIKDTSVFIEDSGNTTVQTGNVNVLVGEITMSSTSAQNITHTGASGQNLKISSTNGSVELNDTEFNEKVMILYETNGGGDSTTLKAPSNVTISYTLTLPSDVGTSNQVLTTGTTPGTSEWTEQVVGNPPGGNINAVQFNDQGSFNGTDNFLWNSATQALTLNASVIGVTTLNMSSDLTNTGGDILLTDSNARAITHTGGSGDLVISSGNDVVVDSVTFSNGAMSGISTLNMSGNLTNTGGDILLTDANARAITHTGGSGDLTISSGSDVVVDSVTFSNGAMSGISTLNMSGNLTNTSGDILLTSSSSQNITHTGGSGDLSITSGGNVKIETVDIGSDALTEILSLNMSGNLTNTGGDILLTDTNARAITHTGGSGNLTISSGSNVVVDSITFNNDILSGISTLNMSGNLTNTGGDILLTDANTRAITHTGGSGDLTISSGSNVVIETVTINGNDITNITDLSLSGDTTFTPTSSVNITHTGGSGNLSLSSGSNVIVDTVTFNNGSVTNVSTLSMTGNLDITTNDILLSSSSSQNITHTGQVGQNLNLSSGGNVEIETVNIGGDEIIANGYVRSNDSLILEDSGAGTNTITLKCAPSSNNTITLPSNIGSANQLLRTDGFGVTTWIDDPNIPGGPNTSIQYNDSGLYGGSSDLTWTDNLKLLNVNGKVQINFSSDSGTPGLIGSVLNVKAQTYTDNTGGPTTSNAVFFSLEQPTLAASSATTTTTASNLYIAGAPIAGTNQTITNSYSLWIDNDDVKIDDNIVSDSGITSQNLIGAHTLTDGQFTIFNSDITGANTITVTTMTLDNFITDGTATLTGGVLSGLVTPTVSSDAVNKLYADTEIQSLKWKDKVRLASTTNVSLTGNQTIDGVLTVDGDRVLLKDQTLPRQNGIWITDTNAWSRASDLAEGALAAGSAMLIESGDTLSAAGYLCNNDPGSDVVGNDAGTTGDDLNFIQFTGAGVIEAGDGLDLDGKTFSVNVDESTIKIFSDNLEVADNGISTSKISNNAVTTVKILDNNVTNLKLNNTSLTFTAGDGLQNGGSVILGNSKSIAIDSTVLRTSGDQSASGIQSFTDTTESTSTTTGAIKVSGGFGVSKNIYVGGLLNAGGVVQGSVVTNGTVTLTGGNLTGVNSINCSSLTTSGVISADTFTDTVVSLNSGSFTSVVNINASGILNSDSFSDSTSTLTNGTLSSLNSPTLGNDASTKGYVDTKDVTAGDGLVKILTNINMNVDNITIEIIDDKIQVKDNSITDSKLASDSVITSKILDANVTNAKLANTQFTFSSGSGIQSAGSVSLGDSITLNMDNSVLRTTGNQIASGIQSFTNVTESTNTTTGAVVVSGGLGISKNFFIGGNLQNGSSKKLTSNSFEDNTLTLSSGNFTGVDSINCASITTTSTIQGDTLTDSSISVTNGNFSGVVNITASGNISTNGSLEDSTAILSGGILTGLNTPTADSHATNKLYVDSQSFGTNWIAPARVATTGNIALSGLQTIDEETLIANDRVLVKDQDNKVENGVYDAVSGSWSRSSDMSSGSVEDTSVFITEGNINLGTSWIVTATTPFLLGSSNLTFTKFASSGEVNPGDALEKVITTYNVLVSNTTVEVVSDQLQIVDDSISNAIFISPSVTTDKIANGAVTNTKLANATVVIGSGDGLQNGGSVDLGSSTTLDVDTTVLRTTGNQSASGIQSFTNVTQSGSISTGALILSGGLGIVKNLYVGGDLNSGSKQVSGNVLSDSSFSLTSGNITGAGTIGCVSVTSTGSVQGNSLTDGTATLTSGSFSDLVNINASGNITGDSLTDNVATLNSGTLSGLVTPTAPSHVTNKDYVDGISIDVGTGSALSKIGTEFFLRTDNTTVEIVTNELSLVDGGISETKLNTNSVITAKITNGAVTNAKLANATVVIGSGDGLQNGGSVDLGSSTTLDVDTTVLRTTGNQSASGIQSFTNTTTSSSATTGAMIVTGGLGVGGDIFSTGIIQTNNVIEAVTFVDGTATITAGNINGLVNTNCGSLTCSSTLEGTTLTDSVASITNGNISSVVNKSMSGTLTLSAIPDTRILFSDNSGQVTSDASLVWNGTRLTLPINTQNISRPNLTSGSSLWLGTGDVNIGDQVTGIFQLGLGPMLKLTTTTSILQSSLTIQGNFSRRYINTSISTAADVTYTAEQIFNGLITRDCNGDNRTDIFPTAQDLVDIVPEPVAGSSYEVIIRNTSSGLFLLNFTTNTTPSTGTVTFSEPLSVSAGTSSRLLIVLNNIFFNQWDVTVFASSPKNRIIMQCSFTDPSQGGNSVKYAQWGPEVASSVVDSTVIGFSGSIIQLVCSYSHNSPISTSTTQFLNFSIGTADSTLSTFTQFTGGLDVVSWGDSVNGTYPSTSSGTLSIGFLNTDRISIRSAETGNVGPQGFNVRCAITFELN